MSSTRLNVWGEINFEPYWYIKVLQEMLNFVKWFAGPPSTECLLQNPAGKFEPAGMEQGPIVAQATELGTAPVSRA